MAAWAVLILVATTVHVPDVVLRTPVSWLDKLAHGSLYLVLGWLTGAAMCAGGALYGPRLVRGPGGGFGFRRPG